MIIEMIARVIQEHLRKRDAITYGVINICYSLKSIIFI